MPVNSVRAYALAAAVAAGACSGGARAHPPPPGPCQIQSDSEHSPGYPYDLTTFSSQVAPELVADCSASSCHGPDTEAGNFAVWPDAAQRGASAQSSCDFARTFNQVSKFADLTTPTNSAIYVAVSGGLVSHPFHLDRSDPRLTALLAYIRDAAARGGGGSVPPPGPSPFSYAVFEDKVQPMLDSSGCTTAACHGGGAGGLTLARAPVRASPTMQANFIAATGRTNLSVPEHSLFYQKAAYPHDGGATTAVAGADRDALLGWIRTAAGLGGGSLSPCAPVANFNLGVFRDQIMPILSGDVNLNDPGTQGPGCTRGPCHGQDRGPGVLELLSDASAMENLQHFACFVNLADPSRSEILLCPLDLPGCRTSHPGQNVFGGAGDLNYQRVLSYVLASRPNASPLDFAFFVRKVNPTFSDRNAVEGGAANLTCASATTCHGVNVVGQSPPNGSNFSIIPDSKLPSALAFNFASAANFINFLSPDESSLFLYPTDEIADTAHHKLATGLHHPGGADFAPDSQFAKDILTWARGLRPDAGGAERNWLVAGDYSASQLTDPTGIDERNITPRIFDSAGPGTLNDGIWDGLFSDTAFVDLGAEFPRPGTSGRVAYAVAYFVNTTGKPIDANLQVTSPNPLLLITGTGSAATTSQGNGQTTVTARVTLAPFSAALAPTRVLVKVLQRAGDAKFGFELDLVDATSGAPLTDSSGIVVTLGPKGGI